MLVKNFVFRQNWVGRRWLVWKKSFLPFLTQPVPRFWPQKAQIRNSLSSILVQKDRNYILSTLWLQMQTLGLHDLTIFKCFRVIFTLKKKTIRFPLSLNLYFRKQKSPKVVNLSLSDETLCLGFWRHKQEKWLFQFSKLSPGS